MPNNTTYQELIGDNREYKISVEEYQETLQKVKENIAEYTHAHPQTIQITPETRTITIDTTTHKPILTHKNIEKLCTYLGVDDIIIYKPNTTLIIDYNQERTEEEEYYL